MRKLKTKQALIYLQLEAEFAYVISVHMVPELQIAKVPERGIFVGIFRGRGCVIAASQLGQTQYLQIIGIIVRLKRRE